MADLPLEGKKEKKPGNKKTSKPVIERNEDGSIVVTKDNAAMLSVHYLAQIYSRLGYLIKIIEGKKNG
jgi:hypothetical protein